MSRLLRADFTRLFKGKIFWGGIIFMIGFGGTIVYNRWKEMRLYPDYIDYTDSILFAGTMFIGMALAVVIGSFIGEDYKSGTIRNKHIIGHSRLSMYLSNLIICVFVSVIMHGAWLTVFFAGERLGLIRGFTTPSEKIILSVLVSFLPVIAFASIFLMICMLITSKSASSVTALVLSFVMMMTLVTLQSALSAPEYYEPYTLTSVNEDGEEVEEYFEGERNRSYPTGIKRKVYEFLYDFMPNGQIAQIANMEEMTNDKAELFSIYSFSIILVTTITGALVFRVKDLK